MRRGAVLIVVLLACLGLVAGGAAYWWTEIRDRDAKQAKTVLDSFIPALRRHDYATACRFVAESAPPMKGGPGKCPRRLRQTGIGNEGWSYQLLSIATRVEGRDDGHIHVIAYQPQAGLEGTGPTYRFTFVRENGALRIEHYFDVF